MMKKIITYCLFFSFLAGLQAQQDVLFTQFAYDKLGYNPAYAGAHDHISLNAIYRNQWLGLDGSPSRFAASINFPGLDQNLGLGLHIDKTTISIFDKTTIQGSYSYKIPLNKGNISVGLSTSLRQFMVDWTDNRLRPPNGFSNDNSVEQEIYTKQIFNVGFGAYYNNEDYFVGAAIPRLNKAVIDFDSDLDTLQATEARLIYFMAGGKFSISEAWELSPQALLTMAEAAPIQFELSAIGILRKKYHVGLNYSSGGSVVNPAESIDLILGYQHDNQIFLGMSYDITISELRQFSSGSLELILNYRFNRAKNAEVIINPRYY